MALVTAGSEPFAMAATIAGGEVLPAVISEANILTNRVHHAYEVFPSSPPACRRPSMHETVV